MNGTDRLERELTTWFADTAAPRVPDYTADILGATATIRQRPRWSFPARWLPAAVVPRLPRLTLQHVPWRTIALLALLGLLLAAAVTLYVGSRPRLPAPFGPAANGLVAYAELGEIWTVDPVTGDRKQDRVDGRRQPGPPIFSRRDARRVPAGELKAGNCSRSRMRTARTLSSRRERRLSGPTSMRFRGHRTVARSLSSADSGLGRTTYLVDTTTGEVRDLDTPGVEMEVYWRPPDGRELLYATGGDLGRRHLFLVPFEGGPEREVPILDRAAVGNENDLDIRPGGWTIDGQRFVVHRSADGSAEAGEWTSLLDPETGQRHDARHRIRPHVQRRGSHRWVPGLSNASVALRHGTARWNLPRDRC